MQKRILRQVFLLFLLAGIVYACMDESDFFSSKDKLPPEVAAAKAWYESQVEGGELPWESVNGKETDTFLPDWKKAFSNEDADYQVIEVHLEGEEKVIFVSPECAEKYRETGDKRYMASDTRLVIRTNKETNETDGFMMVVFPDLSYLEAHKDHPLKDMSYLKRDKEFGGMVYYHDMDGRFVNGCQYIDGKVYNLTPNADQEASGEPQLRTWICTTVCITTYYYTDWYVNGDYQNTTYDGYSIECYTSCYEDGNSDYGGGGGGGNPNPTVTVELKGKSTITLMDSYDLKITISPAGTSRTSVKYLINEQYILENINSTTCNVLAKKPGHFTIKAIVNGTIESNPLEVEVQYPNLDKIKNNGTVLSNMNAVWQATKNATSATDGRSEKGFWIYVNTINSTPSYECGTTISGPSVPCESETNGSVTPGSPTENPSSSPIIGGKYAVAFFHTHTLLVHCPSTNIRYTGPTSEDNSFSYPGLVYDYFGLMQDGEYGYLEPGYIRGGHDINMDAHIFKCGPTRRETPDN